MTLPEYINCKSKTITHCDFYMHIKCPETCNYAQEVLGIGATDQGTAKRIKEGLEKITDDDTDPKSE